MSWDRYTHEEPCLCGAGKRIIEDASDDWGRSEHSERFDCEKCARDYVMVPRRGREDRGYHWVSREEWDKAMAEAEARNRAHDAEAAAIRDEVADRFVAAFAHLGSRKALYKELTRLGFRGHDVAWFTWFNRAVRERGREAVLLGLITRENLELVRKLTRAAQAPRSI